MQCSGRGYYRVCGHVHPENLKSMSSAMHFGALQVNSDMADHCMTDFCIYMTDDMLGPSPMHIKYSSYVYNEFCI